jgi:hypothetical protein
MKDDEMNARPRTSDQGGSNLAEDQRARLRELRFRGLGWPRYDEVEEALIELGLIENTEGRLVLTEAGIQANATWAYLPAQTQAGRVARAVYERFPGLNQRLLEAVSRWQVLPSGLLNDHTDEEYDFNELDRVDAVVEEAARSLTPLAEVAPGFADYGNRLRAALRRAEQGERSWLASPSIPSVHTVWMELHADLLAAVGADRAAEPPMP